jgi:hypothetical protein
MSHCKNRLATDRIKIAAIAPQPSPKQQRRSRVSAMNQIWQFFLTAFDGEPIRIWQTSDSDGNTWWHGRDRKTGCSIDSATESEIRAWIEKRYCK